MRLSASDCTASYSWGTLFGENEPRKASTVFDMLRDRPWHFAHTRVFMFPCWTVNDFFFPRQIFGCFCIFWDIWVLRIPHFQRGKDTHTVNHRGLGRGTLNTGRIQGYITQKRRDIYLNFSAVNVQKSGFPSLLLDFSVDSILGFNYDLILVLQSQFFEYLS